MMGTPRTFVKLVILDRLAGSMSGMGALEAIRPTLRGANIAVRPLGYKTGFAT